MEKLRFVGLGRVRLRRRGVGSSGNISLGRIRLGGEDEAVKR